MKILLFVVFTLTSHATFAHDVTFYLIRHAQAEKDDTKNPHLSELGKTQAAQWISTLKHVNFDAIYSSNYYRTQETAEPIANDKNLEIQSYDAKNLDTNLLIRKHNGKKILIVGHSNTTPDNVNKLLGGKRYQWIDHDDHGYLFIVRVYGKKVSVEKLKVFK